MGRGTRLCEDLFGPSQHKTIFRIFDHWGNFDRLYQIEAIKRVAERFSKKRALMPAPS